MNDLAEMKCVEKLHLHNNIKVIYFLSYNLTEVLQQLNRSATTDTFPFFY